ncbi:hypothetical protein BJF85_07420 [Saccharomonospora sp. CUA-673]|uniref:hypothetical protein n=1 Tax=Saccharomonospora sp. CUA-673 TaxID=1904969 RepID=UPI00095AB24C|nr:hypothetical protein [Saccharomonospora sp. CUA-673]OLT39041.1 hypothetical protein BJF85_07420 [Saccharomonospora sp. CUA-673]
MIVLDTEGEAVRHGEVVASLPLGAAVIAPHRTSAATWLAAAGDRLDLAVGTARTMHGDEFDVVLVDLAADDWHARTRAFASATSRARSTLYLLADAATLAAAPQARRSPARTSRQPTYVRCAVAAYPHRALPPKPAS